MPVKVAPVTEGAILVVLTLCISIGVFEMVRRVPLLRPLFGIGPRHAAAPQHEAVPQPVLESKKPATANC